MEITPEAHTQTSTAHPCWRHAPRDRPWTPMHLPTAPTLTYTQGKKERKGGREGGREKQKERTKERKSLCLHRTQSPAYSLRVMPEGTVPSWPPCVAQWNSDLTLSCPSPSPSSLPHPSPSLLQTQSLWLITVFHPGEIPSKMHHSCNPSWNWFILETETVH